MYGFTRLPSLLRKGLMIPETFSWVLSLKFSILSTLLFALNFSPSQSLTNVLVPVRNNADYEVVLSSDDEKYGGQNLVEHITYSTKKFDGQNYVELYLPARTAIVLKETIKPEPKEDPKIELKKETKK